MPTTIGIRVYVGDAVSESELNTLKDKLENGDSTNSKSAEKVREDTAKEITENIQLYGVSNIPELTAAPTSIDVTSLEDYESVAEPGQIQNANLGLTLRYKEFVYTDKDVLRGEPAAGSVASTEEYVGGDKSNFELALNIYQHDEIRGYVILLPTGRWFMVYAKCAPSVAAMSVAAAQDFTFTIYKRSKVYTGYFDKPAPDTTGKSATPKTQELIGADNTSVDEE